SWMKSGGITRRSLTTGASLHVKQPPEGGWRKAACGTRQTAKSSSLRPEATAARSHFGCRPRPLQESPVSALRYLAATLRPACDLDFAGPLVARSDTVKPYSDISARTLAIAALR